MRLILSFTLACLIYVVAMLTNALLLLLWLPLIVLCFLYMLVLQFRQHMTRQFMAVSLAAHAKEAKA